jgi:hypothetical protein
MLGEKKISSQDFFSLLPRRLGGEISEFRFTTEAQRGRAATKIAQTSHHGEHEDHKGKKLEG